ncbi:hypothetical protein HF265_21630 [Rhizobium leguminosarum]|uniref:hypothetical protein n=1 Tax=Rhizobium leguminosarum TaxID=384 RepID=UPI001C91140F|nr:hypothetical protein [Rhizobium leguminosarum]MBY3031654.1 hypothetical protein [Rhizobium leguminosarum]
MPLPGLPGKSMPPHLIEKAQAVARHEVGHWAIGYCLGFKVGDISIVIQEVDHYRGHAVIELESDLSSLELVESYLRRRIMVLFAGVMAESLKPNGVPQKDYAKNELEKGGATNDHKGIRELLRVLRGVAYGPPRHKKKLQGELDTLNDELWNATEALVMKHHKLILGLGGAIAEKASARGKAFGLTETQIVVLPDVAEWLAANPPPK